MRTGLAVVAALGLVALTAGLALRYVGPTSGHERRPIGLDSQLQVHGSHADEGSEEVLDLAQRKRTPAPPPVAAAAPGSLPELVGRVKQSVVTLHTFGADGRPLSQGTGFYGSSRIVVTNLHVIEGAYRVEIVDAEGRSSDARGQVAVDINHDLALIMASQPLPSGVPALALAPAEPIDGQCIVVVGSPLGLEQTVTEGIVSSARRVLPGGRVVVQVTAPISPGSSGSPVMNLHGEVLGVAACHMVNGQALNFAVPAQDIRALRAQPVTSFERWSGERDRVRAHVQQLVDRAWARILRPIVVSPRRQDLELQAAKDALPLFAKALRLDPKHASAWSGLASCKSVLGDSKGAVGAYQAAMRLKPTAYLAIDLGMAHADLGNYEAALAALSRGIELDPELEFTYFDRACVLVDAGRDADALRAFRIAYGRFPDGMNVPHSQRVPPGFAVLRVNMYFESRGEALRGFATGVALLALFDFDAVDRVHKWLARLNPDLARRLAALR